MAISIWGPDLRTRHRYAKPGIARGALLVRPPRVVIHPDWPDSKLIRPYYLFVQY